MITLWFRWAKINWQRDQNIGIPEIYRKSLEDACGGINCLVKLKAKWIQLYWKWTPSQVFVIDFL